MCDQWMTLQDVADHMGRSYNTLKTWTARGKFPPHEGRLIAKSGFRANLWTRETVMLWIDQHTDKLKEVRFAFLTGKLDHPVIVRRRKIIRAALRRLSADKPKFNSVRVRVCGGWADDFED